MMYKRCDRCGTCFNFTEKDIKIMDTQDVRRIGHSIYIQDVKGKIIECPVCHYFHLLYIIDFKNNAKKLSS